MAREELFSQLSLWTAEYGSIWDPDPHQCPPPPPFYISLPGNNFLCEVPQLSVLNPQEHIRNTLYEPVKGSLAQHGGGVHNDI